MATANKIRIAPETEPDQPVSNRNALFAADGKGIYLTTDRDSEFQRLAYLGLSSRNLTFLAPGIAWDVDEIDLSRDGGALAFTTNEAGASRLHLLDTRTRRHRPIPGVPLGVIENLRWHPDSREVGFSLSSVRAASDVYSVDARSGAVTRWTESELGGLVAGELVEPELVRWRSFDGLELSGFYYRPPARFSGRRPVIIDIHGGPESQARPEFLGRSNYFLVLPELPWVGGSCMRVARGGQPDARHRTLPADPGSGEALVRYPC